MKFQEKRENKIKFTKKIYEQMRKNTPRNENKPQKKFIEKIQKTEQRERERERERE